MFYRWSIDKPATPSGTSVPSGWSDSPDRENPTMTYGGTFTLKNGYRYSPVTEHGAASSERIDFTTTKPNQVVVVDLHVSSEARYDKAIIGELDTSDFTTVNLDSISGTGSKVIYILVPDAGAHFFYIAYSKDASVSQGTDNCWYRIIQDSVVHCWFTQARIGADNTVKSWTEPQIFIQDDDLEERIYLLRETATAPSTPDSLEMVDDYVPPISSVIWDDESDFHTGDVVMRGTAAYKAVENNSGIDPLLDTGDWEEVPTWTDNPSSVNATYRYQYMCFRRKSNGKWGSFTLASLFSNFSKDGAKGDKGDKGDTGNTGLDGIVIRRYYWEEGIEAHNDVELVSSGLRYLDYAFNIPIALVGTTPFKVYKCKQTHVTASSKPLTNTTYWEEVNVFKDLFAPIILTNALSADFIDVLSLAAKQAFIEALRVKHLDAADGLFSGIMRYPYKNLLDNSMEGITDCVTFDTNDEYTIDEQSPGSLRIPRSARISGYSSKDRTIIFPVAGNAQDPEWTAFNGTVINIVSDYSIGSVQNLGKVTLSGRFYYGANSGSKTLLSANTLVFDGYFSISLVYYGTYWYLQNVMGNFTAS